MDFKTVNLIKHGTGKVWLTMRDNLPDLAKMMDDIESITEKERTSTDGIIRITNIWKSGVKLPQVIINYLGTDFFMWTDRAEWNNETYECNWKIELHQFRDAVQCHGKTIFEPAMGGKGTKVTFSGDLEWDSMKLSGITGALGEAVFIMAGDIVRNIIQKNFRKTAETIALYLDNKTKDK